MKKILYLIGLVFVLSACSDFLDRQSLSELSSDTFWSSQKEAEMALAGCFDALQAEGLYFVWPGNWTCSPRELDCVTDDGFYTWDYLPANDIAKNTLTASSTLVSTVWKACYRGIARCNQVILYVPKMDPKAIDKSQADRIVGEAKFLRAFLYNYLTSLYRDVPLSLEPTATGHIKKSSKAEIIKYITGELEEVAASDALPVTLDDNAFGRITKGAVYALLCRIYLYNDMYAEAADAANKVIQSGKYGIAPKYDVLFSDAGTRSNEIIFSVRYSGLIKGEEGFLSLGNAYVWGPMNWLLPYKNLVDEYYYIDGKAITDPSSSYKNPTDFSTRDPRLKFNIITPGTWWGGWGTVDETGPSKGYYFGKWQQDDWDWYDSQDYYVIRYADVLLMRAEALAKSGGNKSEIINLINQVRQRPDVMMPTVETAEGTNLTHDQLFKVIQHERRVEFAFEGFRYLDLLRWKELDKAFARARAEGMGGAHTFLGAKNYVWPIPQEELDNNPVLDQAPEWGGK